MRLKPTRLRWAGQYKQGKYFFFSKRGIEPIHEERFREANFGILEGISTELVTKPGCCITQNCDLEELDMDYRPYEGEDTHDVISKHSHRALQKTLQSFSSDDDTILIVSWHGLFSIWIYQIIITSTIF